MILIPASNLSVLLNTFLQYIPLALTIPSSDRLLYQTNPRDYMIKQNSDYDYYNLEKAITEFINYLNRELDDFPSFFYQYCLTKLQEYSSFY